MNEFKKIKICYVASVDITLRFILLSYLKLLKKEGYEVYAVCSPGNLVKDIEAAGIKVKTIGFKRKISPISDMVSFFRLYFYFRKEKFDIVHTHTLKPEFFGQIAAKLAGVPIIVNSLLGFDFAEDAPLLKKKFFILIEKAAAKCSNLIFSVSRKIIRDSINYGICSADKLQYMGYGINPSRFDPAKFSEEFILKKKKQLGIDPNKKVIGIVARLVAEKGYLDLFVALKEVLLKFPQVVLLVVGQEEPEKKDAISSDIAKKYGIENNTIFLGERIDTEELYSLIDIFVLPSHREGLGVATLEASAMEIPAIVSNTGGCPEAVDDRKTGILVPLKNPKKLAEAVLFLLANPEIAKEMGKAGRKKILKEFSEEIVFDRIRTNYQKLADIYLKKGKIKVCCVASVDITLKFMLFNQLNFLKNQGYNIFVVCSSGRWIKDIEAAGIKVKTIGFKRKISPISDMVSFFRLYFYFRKEKFDIVHTHTLKPEFFGQIAAKLAGVPIIINTLHGFDFAEDASFLNKKFFILIEKVAARCSDLIFSISREIIKTAVEENICRVNLIKYLGRDINNSRFDPAKFSEEFILKKKKQLGIDPNKKVIGIVARLVAEKGYLDLFVALKEVLLKFPQVVLLIVGQEEPEKKDAIKIDIVKEYGIENNIMFLGERTDTEELYSLMDIFVLPTHREGLGAAILEASAMKKPVIATNTGGCPEAVENGRTGILVPIKSPNKLSEAIIFLLSDSTRAKKMGEAGREKILREFNEEIVFDRMKKEYTGLIKNKK